jgi:hypothetical protein
MAGRLTDFTYQGKTIVNNVFIETGTYQAETTQNAFDAGFSTIHTIDVCERHYKNAKDKFANNKIVFCHFGSSPDVLPIVCDPKLKTTFYLDGHYQGYGAEEMDQKLGECPIIQEIEIIKNIKWNFLPIIIIDDAHIFIMKENRKDFMSGKLLNDSHWPYLEDIENVLKPMYEIEIYDDRIYCIPN